MGDKSKIEWTDASWNPVRGCTKVSAGCDNCYAMGVAHRMGGRGRPYSGLTRMLGGRPQWNGRVRLVPELLDQPLRWKRPRRIFVNSMSDLFHEAIPFDFIDQVFAVMALCPHHTFQVLTKRPERMREYFHAVRSEGFTEGYVGCLFDRPARAFPQAFAKLPLNNTAKFTWPIPNVWLGVTAEDQDAAKLRIPLLIDTPAAVRFVSYEPALGAVDMQFFLGVMQSPRRGWKRVALFDHSDPRTCGEGSPIYKGLQKSSIDWVIAGGESGPHARPIHPDWVRLLRDQCAAAGVPFFFKQWGEWAPRLPAPKERCIFLDTDGNTYPESAAFTGDLPQGVCSMVRVGKRWAGRLLDGRIWDGAPA